MQSYLQDWEKFIHSPFVSPTFFSFFGSTGIWIQDAPLAKQVIYHSSTFWFSDFSDRISCFLPRPDSYWTGIAQSWVYKHTPPGLVLLTFCPGWPQTMIFPISTSQVAWISSMCHYTCVCVCVCVCACECVSVLRWSLSSSPGWCQTCDPPVWASWVLELQACTSIPGLPLFSILLPGTDAAPSIVLKTQEMTLTSQSPLTFLSPLPTQISSEIIEKTKNSRPRICTGTE
jgi:hypothetical protein